VSEEYTRRQVIGQLASTAAATALRPLAPLVPTGGGAKRVIVVGAGLAGLCAAYELAALGHDVSILEAQERPGGRVQTLRAPFTDDLYAEAGASRIPTSHDLTLGYVRVFGLPVVPFEPVDPPSIRYAYGSRARVLPGAPCARTVRLPLDAHCPDHDRAAVIAPQTCRRSGCARSASSFKSLA
jgi:Flavin containing amine oxidoreductase